MGEVVYISRVQVVRQRGPLHEAHLPGREDAVTFGVHSEMAAHYGVSSDDYPLDATTMDHVVAVACG
jgi:hypothetical protein